MRFIMSNENIPKKSVTEAWISCEGLSPSSLGMYWQVPGGSATNKTFLNGNNEENVIVLLEEQWKDFFWNSMEITSFDGFSCKSSNEVDLDIN